MHHATKKQLASLFWPKFSRAVEAVNRNAEMMATIRNLEASGVHKFANREQLYSEINSRFGNVAITYLEFGVWRGESLEAWTRINTNETSRFYGFDSFEGLPEDWLHAFGVTKQGDFGLKGEPPKISDQRVKLVKGWFQDTLRDFLQHSDLAHPIVVHNDSDLHSSTHYTLSTLDPFLKAGDVVVFDEYSSAINEYLAWEQYKRAFMREAKCVGMSDRWTQAAFVIL
jgi:O-methyltransferase